MSRFAVLLLAVSAFVSGAEATAEKKEQAELKRLCSEWLGENDDAKERAAWTIKTVRRIKQKTEDQDVSEQRAADDVCLEWLRGIRDQLDHPDKLSKDNRILFCRWLLLYHEHGWEFDATVKDHLTVANFRKWIANDAKQTAAALQPN